MSSVKVEIFSQGEEVISGQTADTNAAWLSQQLVTLGFQVSRHTTVGDDLSALVELLNEISMRAECCICTGGLGPTVDDLTSQAVAKAFNCPLLLDTQALQQIKHYFQRSERIMTDSNRKQALLPQGAQRLNNDWGTAPGFSILFQGCLFFFLPGVPYEMRHMFQVSVKPVLESGFNLNPGHLVTLSTIGMGESALQDKLKLVSWPDQVKLGFRTMMPEVQTKLMFPPGYAQQAIRAFTQQVADTMGTALFSIDGAGQSGGNLSTVVDRLLTQRQQTLAIVETFSAGQMTVLCNATHWLSGSLVVSDAEQLNMQLGLSKANNCSQKVEDTWRRTEQLATKIRQKFNTDYGIAQIAIENHNANMNSSGIIRVYFVLAMPQGFERGYYDAQGKGAGRQKMAAALAIDLLRCHLERSETSC